MELAFHADGAAYKLANAELEQYARRSGSASPRSPRDHESIVAWFDDALTQTMPGRSGKLPPAPHFEGVPKAIDHAATPAGDNPVQPNGPPGDGAAPIPATPASAETAAESPDEDAASATESPADHSIAVRPRPDHVGAVSHGADAAAVAR